jgi:hypothetical protein
MGREGLGSLVGASIGCGRVRGDVGGRTFEHVTMRFAADLDRSVALYRGTFRRWGNPSVKNVRDLFRRIGVQDVFDGLSWQRCLSAAVRLKLEKLNQLRNQIAHGADHLILDRQRYSLSLAEVYSLRNFKAQIADNLDRYRSGDFSFLDLDSTQYHELPLEGDSVALNDLKLSAGDEHFEVENCLAVHGFLSSLTPYDARDERLWCYLSHTLFLPHARARWPIPTDDEKAVKHIQTHFFASTNRQVERDNVASRLWWMAHLCTRVSGATKKESLEAFLFRADVRANIIERPTVAQSTNVFSVILQALIRSTSGKKALFERATFRKVMIELNSIGGFKLLDALPESELGNIFEEVVSKRVGLAAL